MKTRAVMYLFVVIVVLIVARSGAIPALEHDRPAGGGPPLIYERLDPVPGREMSDPDPLPVYPTAEAYP